MAWLYKQKGSANWWIGYRANGKQFLRSTDTADRAKAEAELHKVEALYSVKNSAGLLADVYAALSGKTTPKVTLAGALDDWIAESTGSTSKSTLKKYRQIADDLKGYFKATAAGPLLADIETEPLREFLVEKRKHLAASTVNNGYRKIISIFFLRAIKNGQTKENPTTPIKPFKPGKDEGEARRAFTMEELALIHSKAPDKFWKYMIVAGFFLGQRMGDIICMRWGNVDFEQRTIRITTGKTGRKMQIPMAPQLFTLLEKLRQGITTPPPASAFIWPEQAAVYLAQGAQQFSREFYDILTTSGLTVARTASHSAQKNGRRAKRDTAAVSYHCLRHTFISMLRTTGGNQAVAKELAGHSSDLMNDGYTHNSPEILAKAVNALPTIETK